MSASAGSSSAQLNLQRTRNRLSGGITLHKELITRGHNPKEKCVACLLLFRIFFLAVLCCCVVLISRNNKTKQGLYFCLLHAGVFEYFYFFTLKTYTFVIFCSWMYINIIFIITALTYKMVIKTKQDQTVKIIEWRI